MKKIVLGTIAVIVIAVAAAFSYFYVNLDGLVKGAIEKYGSQVAGVKVSVAAVKLDVPNGKVSISGLTVGNPSGFNSPTALKLGEVSVALDTAKSSKTLIDITRVLIVSPEVTYELGGQGGISNIQAIQNNVQAFSAKAGGGSSTEAQKPTDDKNAAKLVIDVLDVTNGKVNLAAPIPGVAAGAPLGDIHLTNIGKDSGGATPQQVAEQLLNAVSKSATKAAGSIGIGNVTDAAKGAVESVTKGADPAKALNGLLK